MNNVLLQYDPPLHVEELFEDIRDGVRLLCLLEVLSGEKLVCYTHLIYLLKYETFEHYIIYISVFFSS